MTADTKIQGEALDWLVQINDAGFDRWGDWDLWMAADPRHAEAYWALAEADAGAVEALQTTSARSPSQSASVTPFRARVRPPTFPRRAAMAAAAVLVVGGAVFGWTQRPQPWSIETRTGEQRTVQLADGSNVILDSGTRLTLDHREPRKVRLDAGRALFTVVYDEAHPFLVEAGGATLTDLGTIFDVTHLSDGARVAVSQGSVRIDAGAASAVLTPGDSVVSSARGLERGATSIEAVSAWTEGRLTYAGERLDVVAQDLTRSLGRPVVVAPAIAGQRFSGSMGLAQPSPAFKARLAVLLDVSIVDDGSVWRLQPRRAP